MINVIDTNELKRLAKEAYQNSYDHGWHETEREPEEVISLFHSEISEAFEDFRNHKMELEILESGKPVGLPSEIADIAIRLLDIYGQYNRNPDPYILDKDSATWNNRSISWWIFQFHYELKWAIMVGYRAMVNPYNFKVFDSLFGLLFIFCDKFNIDLMNVIEVKHFYNKSRPYRHGGKAA
jgi:hypothetical protein